MAADLDTELQRLFRPLSLPPAVRPSPSTGANAAAPTPGDSRRNGPDRSRGLDGWPRRRPAVIRSPHEIVRVGSNGAANVSAPPPARDVPGAEPATFVAELSSGHIAVVDSHTGRVLRRLTPVAHDIFGTLSADRRTFYLDVGSRDEPNCPTGSCAIDTATGAVRPIPAFRWGSTKPFREQMPISPDGTHATSTEFPSSPLGSTSTSMPTPLATVVIATTTAHPVTYTLPAGSQVYADSLWSPQGTYLNVANVPGVPGIRTSAPIVMEAATGTLTTLHVPGGCSVEPMVLSDTELFTTETCARARILPFGLASGTPEAPIAYPAHAASPFGLGTDPTGRYLVATYPDSHDGSTPFPEHVWTLHRGGAWQRVPHVSAAAIAW